MNVQEFQDRMAIIQRENAKIGEKWRKLVAEHEKLQEWINNNHPKGFWNCFWYSIQIRFWYDPQVKKIDEETKELKERQEAVQENLSILRSGETPTLH